MAVIHDLARGKFYGVQDEARKLKVSPGHLYLCVSGQRKPGKELAKKIRITEVA